MKLIKNAVILAGALTLTASVFADNQEVSDDVTKEVKEFRGFVKNGFSSDFGGKLIHNIDLSQEQLTALETGMAEIFANMPAPGDVTMEEGIEAGVSAHLKVKELVDSILTDEQKAELEALKAEREAKRAERKDGSVKAEDLTEEQVAEKEAKKAERAAEREVKMADVAAEKEAKKAERAELTEEEVAAKEAKKAERAAAWEAKRAEKQAKMAELSEEDLAELEAKKEEWKAKKAAKRSEKEEQAAE